MRPARSSLPGCGKSERTTRLGAAVEIGLDVAVVRGGERVAVGDELLHLPVGGIGAAGAVVGREFDAVTGTGGVFEPDVVERMPGSFELVWFPSKLRPTKTGTGAADLHGQVDGR